MKPDKVAFNAYHLYGLIKLNIVVGETVAKAQEEYTSTDKLTSVDANIIANGSTYTATIHGLLSGSGASSVTGVFHTNDSRPDYAGAFVAKK